MNRMSDLRSGLFQGVVVLVLAVIASGAAAADTVPIRFAIIGDRTGGHQEGIYQEVVGEIAQLRPDFVMTVGDMIEGYTEDLAIVEQEWVEYFEEIAPFDMPVYYVPGNHDITNDKMEEPYRRLVAEPYYAFTHNDVLFVVLDNSRQNTADEWPAEQLAWADSVLGVNSHARHSLAFFHKPFWYNSVGTGKPDPLHELFVKHGVDAVFSGHFHRYFSAEFDGILYTCIGSSGGSMPPGPNSLGYHYAWVTVDDAGITVAPIKKGSVARWDNYTSDDLHFWGQMNQHALDFSQPFRFDVGLNPLDTSITVIVRNLHDQLIMTDTLEWQVPDGWSITPATCTVTVAPLGERQVSFSVRADGSCFPGPTLTADIPYSAGRSYVIEKPMRIARVAHCNRMDQAATIDGDLSESGWRDPVRTLFSWDGGPAGVDSTRFYFGHDRENIYIAAYCQEPSMDSIVAAADDHDGAVYGEDCVGFFFHPDPAAEPVYQIYVNAIGTIFDQRITPNEDGYYNSDKNWNGDYEIACHHGNDYWTIEMRIPVNQFGVTIADGDEWGVNFRRKQPHREDNGDWQPISYDPKTFGLLKIE